MIGVVNLLSAGFLRLWRSKRFYVTLAIMAAVGAVEVLLGYGAMLDLAAAGAADAAVSLDSRYFIFPFLSGILLSPFCALFVGAEHSDGGLRRKLAAGHSRGAVYLSDLVLTSAVGIFLCLGYITAVLAVGLPLLGPLHTPLLLVLWYTLCAAVMTAALGALYTLIAMLCQSKAVAAVACIFLAYFLLFLGIYLNNRLIAPEMLPRRQYVEDGQIVTVEARPNPDYICGVKRTVYQFFYDLPGCQTVQLAAEIESGVPVRLPLYSLAVAAASAAAGVTLFRRKDLK